MTGLAPEEKRMEAGRELDALVAEKVMGIRVVRPRDGFSWAIIDYGVGPDEPLIGSALSYDGVVPHFSTDIASTWTAVERLIADGWELVLESPACGVEWDAMFAKPNGNDWDFADHGYGATAPLAICLASLKAVSGESPL